MMKKTGVDVVGLRDAAQVQDDEVYRAVEATLDGNFGLRHAGLLGDGVVDRSVARYVAQWDGFERKGCPPELRDLVVPVVRPFCSLMVRDFRPHAEQVTFA